MHQAKSQLSKLIERAEAGEEVVIARNGRPAVRLTPVGEPVAGGRRWLGCLSGRADLPSAAELAACDVEVASLFTAGLADSAPGLQNPPAAGPTFDARSLFDQLTDKR